MAIAFLNAVSSAAPVYREIPHMAQNSKSISVALALVLIASAQIASAADTDGVPTLQLTPATLNFGSVTLGATSASATVEVRAFAGNRGIPDPLANVALTLPAGWQRNGGSCPASGVAPNPCTISLVFSPTTVGLQSGNGQVSASLYGGAPTVSAVALSGTGLPSAAVPAPSLDRLGLGMLISVLLAAGLLSMRQRN